MLNELKSALCSLYSSTPFLCCRSNISRLASMTSSSAQTHIFNQIPRLPPPSIKPSVPLRENILTSATLVLFIFGPNVAWFLHLFYILIFQNSPIFIGRSWKYLRTVKFVWSETNLVTNKSKFDLQLQCSTLKLKVTKVLTFLLTFTLQGLWDYPKHTRLKCFNQNKILSQYFTVNL